MIKIELAEHKFDGEDLPPEEMQAMEEAYQEWVKQLEEAIKSGDEALIEEIWELGK